MVDSNKWGQPFTIAEGPNVPFQPCIIKHLNFYGHYMSTAGVKQTDPSLPRRSLWPFWVDSRRLDSNDVPFAEIRTTEIVP